MSLSLLAPLFLAGLCLMIVPWLIHRIQRPERRPVRFSSLLFIPSMDKEVVQRRRLQHLLLLLLRMTVLALLAFAFSRPFLPAGKPALAGKVPDAAHVLLIDRSFSMGTNGMMAEARMRAREVLDVIPLNEPVAVVAFDETAEVLLPFAEEGEADGERPGVLRSVERIEVSQRGTSYPAALLAAQRLLAAAGTDGSTKRGVIHLISDLQESGFGADANASWRLSPEMDVRPVAVGEAETPNRAVVDVAVRSIREGEFRISGKVKNWSMDGDARFPVSLYVAGKKRATQEIAVLKHHASQVAFDLSDVGTRALEGWIEIAGDALDADNRRYFAWNSPPRRTIAVVTRNQGAEAWPTGWFARAVLEGARDSPYEVVALAPEEAIIRLESGVSRPDVVVAGELSARDPGLNRAILEFLQAGGQAIMTLSPDARPEELNPGLLEALGLRAVQKSGPSEKAASYRLLSWIDFGHPVFQAFQAPQYNDFSGIRVFDHVSLEVGKAAAPGRALIRFEADTGKGDPALIETFYGAGRALVWSFPHDPRVTNLPKSARFAPIIFESVRYLTDEGEIKDEIQVGDAISLEAGTLVLELGTADGRAQRIEHRADEKTVVPEEAGLLRWSGGNGSAGRTVAVNPDPAEGNPVRFSEDAFRLRVMPPEARVPENGVEAPVLAGGGRAPRGPGREFGLALLTAVAVLLFVELWYAPRLVR